MTPKLNIVVGSNSGNLFSGGGIATVFYDHFCVLRRGEFSAIFYARDLDFGSECPGQTTTLTKTNSLFYSLKKIRRASAVVYHGIWSFDCVLFAFVSLLFGKPFILYPHGLLSPIRLRQKKIKKLVYLKTVFPFVVRFSHSIICCSDKEMLEIKEMGLGGKILVIPNGVPRSFIRNSSQSSLYKSNSPVVKFLFLSQLIPIKGVELLIRSVAERKDFFRRRAIFKLAGYGFPAYIGTLRSLVKTLDISDLVSFEGPVFGAKKMALIDSCDYFVFPSCDENFGLVVVEALARGKPVIACHGSPWSILDASRCGFWVPSEVSTLSEALREAVLLGRDSYYTRSAFCIRLVSEKFLTETSVNSLLEHIEAIVNKNYG